VLYLYDILTIEIATIINWTNGIALLGFIPLLIDIVVKCSLYKKSENFDFKEIFDFDFFKSLAIGILIFVFALFENSSKEAEKATLSNKVSGLKTELETIHSKDSAQSFLDRKADKIEILTGIGNAIGKYSLGYDSAKNEIIKLSKLIKDSANRKTTILDGEAPIVGFGPNFGLKLEYKRNDTLRYIVSIVSQDAGATVYQAKLYTLVSFNNIGGIFKDLTFINDNLLINKSTNFAKNGGTSIGADIFGTYSKVKTIIVLLTVSYADSRGNNKEDISQVGILDINSKDFSFLFYPYDDYVIDFLRKKNILDK